MGFKLGWENFSLPQTNQVFLWEEIERKYLSFWSPVRSSQNVIPNFIANCNLFIAKVRNVVIFTGTIQTFLINLSFCRSWQSKVSSLPARVRGRKDTGKAQLAVCRDHKLILFWLDSCKFRLHAHYLLTMAVKTKLVLIWFIFIKDSRTWILSFVRISGIQITKSVDSISTSSDTLLL